MFDITIPKPTVGFASNTYIISSSRECAVIDPSVPYSPELIRGEVKYILLTHSHFDHILEIEGWAEKTGAPVYVSEKEADKVGDSDFNCYKIFFGEDKGYLGKTLPLKEGDKLPLGDEEIRVMECPGHTTGSLTYLIGDCAFVGDTVFAGGGFGRWDLPSGNFSKLRGSIDRISSLNENTKLYPGHGGITTVKEYNDNLKIKETPLWKN